jgi:hypothetical protein
MVAPLSEWLQLMLAEIARKQEEARRGAEEQQARLTELPAERPQPIASS